jgi:hypothetical protein
MTPLQEIESTIENLPPELQIRINTIADMLRAMQMNDCQDETQLAILLIMEEFNEGREVCDCADETVQ